MSESQLYTDNEEWLERTCVSGTGGRCAWLADEGFTVELTLYRLVLVLRRQY
jgi:hypothetical protein